MKSASWLGALLLAAAPALAQTPLPDPRDRGDDAEAAYRRGYERGYERGFERGLEEGMKRGATVAPPPPPPPKPVPTGPIRVTGAFYGTSSKNCDATRFVASRANGKRSYSFEVSNDICGDPARGDRKSLEVTYYCGHMSKTASAHEHRTLYLDCTA
jgi:hypothetical protein